MSFDDCKVIAKALETAGEIIFEEKGYQGGGDNSDVYSPGRGSRLRPVREVVGLQLCLSHQYGVRPEPGRLRRVPALAGEPVGGEVAHGLRREPPVDHAERGLVPGHLHGSPGSARFPRSSRREAVPLREGDRGAPGGSRGCSRHCGGCACRTSRSEPARLPRSASPGSRRWSAMSRSLPGTRSRSTPMARPPKTGAGPVVGVALSTTANAGELVNVLLTI